MYLKETFLISLAITFKRAHKGSLVLMYDALDKLAKDGYELSMECWVWSNQTVLLAHKGDLTEHINMDLSSHNKMCIEVTKWANSLSTTGDKDEGAIQELA